MMKQFFYLCYCFFHFSQVEERQHLFLCFLKLLFSHPSIWNLRDILGKQYLHLIWWVDKKSSKNWNISNFAKPVGYTEITSNPCSNYSKHLTYCVLNKNLESYSYSMHNWVFSLHLNIFSSIFWSHCNNICNCLD